MERPLIEQFQVTEPRIGTTTYTGYRDASGNIISHGFKSFVADDGTREEGNCKHGWRDGIWQSYWPSGRLESRTEYRDGQAHGRETCWFEDGTLKSEKDFVDNHIVRSRRYHPNGQLQEEVGYSGNDDRNGLCSVWDERGKLVARGIYKDDAPWNGTFVITEEIEPSEKLPTFSDYMNAVINRRRAIVAFVNGEFVGPAIVADEGTLPSSPLG